MTDSPAPQPDPAGVGTPEVPGPATPAPEAQGPEWMSEEEFDAAVDAALARIPDELARLLTNVVVVVEEEYEPQRWEDPDTELFGLYEGIPLTERGDLPWQMPDRIVVFRGPLTRHCRSRSELEREITVTVMHEVGHFFGIDEQRLHELGWG
ncbi:MAG: metallopeptidase family protein [Micrococcus sp.]|nr:metallopeptidase family protein [Micrococcus sp.]MDY6056015.1 metallopeptidase family protein [Micrococcus sp.]